MFVLIFKYFQQINLFTYKLFKNILKLGNNKDSNIFSFETILQSNNFKFSHEEELIFTGELDSKVVLIKVCKKNILFIEIVF